MASIKLTLLLAIVLTICNNVDASHVPHKGKRLIGEFGTSWRFPHPFIFAGGEVLKRQECVTGCQPGEKCCTSPEGAQFCIPEKAVCCGRTWCDGELELCCRDGPHGGCCPKVDSQCAIGNKGCCLKDRPCFGPYTCYDNVSVECKNGTVEAFQCCPDSAPFCLFDPGNGYGCFVSKDLPTYTTPIVEVPSTVVKAPTSEGNAPPTTATGTVTATSNPAGVEAPSSPAGGSPTGGYPPLTSAVSTNLASSDLESPSSNGGGDPSVPYSSRLASTTTRRNTTTVGPSSTDGASGGGAVANPGIGYGVLKQVGVAGLALLVVA